MALHKTGSGHLRTISAKGIGAADPVTRVSGLVSASGTAQMAMRAGAIAAASARSIDEDTRKLDPSQFGRSARIEGDTMQANIQYGSGLDQGVTEAAKAARSRAAARAATAGSPKNDLNT